MCYCVLCCNIRNVSQSVSSHSRKSFSVVVARCHNKFTKNGSDAWSNDHSNEVQAALIICGLFICDFAYMWSRNGLFSGTYPLIYSNPWSFYLQIRYMRAYFWSPFLSHVTRSTCFSIATSCIYHTSILERKEFIHKHCKIEYRSMKQQTMDRSIIWSTVPSPDTSAHSLVRFSAMTNEASANFNLFRPAWSALWGPFK